MLTPIGNPQNLYLYGKSGMQLGSFLLLMLPYTALAFLLCAGWGLLICRKHTEGSAVHFEQESQIASKPKLAGYYVLFLLCLLTVARILPFYVPLAAIILFLLAFDRTVFQKVDYALLLTFCGFFVFIGNMGRIEAFRHFLEHIIEGHEAMTAVISSQVISNVPAALLLSGFTSHFRDLIVGTNIGGLGTLIASMASLITFKYIGREKKSDRLPYLVYFTKANLIFIVCMLLLHAGMPH